MFKLQPDPTFTAPVALSVPGLPKRLVVQVSWKHKNRAAMNAWLQSAKGKSEATFLDEIIAGWSGLIGPDGAEVTYSYTALTDLIDNYPTAFNELFDAYRAELLESKQKN